MAGAVLNVAKPTANSTLLISGMGGVGFGALFSAKNLGVKTIIAVDTVESRLALVRIEVKALHRIGSETSNQAEKAGATHTINAKTTDVLQQLASITQERGVDLAIEATGVASAAKVAFMSLGMRGVQASRLFPLSCIHRDTSDGRDAIYNRCRLVIPVLESSLFQ